MPLSFFKYRRLWYYMENVFWISYNHRW
jgi:hypothetical protein